MSRKRAAGGERRGGEKGGYRELREFKEIKEFRDYVLRIIDDSAFLKLSNFPKLPKLPISALSSPSPRQLTRKSPEWSPFEALAERS